MIDFSCLSVQMWLLDSLQAWRSSSSNRLSRIAVFQNELRYSSIVASSTTKKGETEEREKGENENGREVGKQASSNNHINNNDKNNNNK